MKFVTLRTNGRRDFRTAKILAPLLVAFELLPAVGRNQWFERDLLNFRCRLTMPREPVYLPGDETGSTQGLLCMCLLTTGVTLAPPVPPRMLNFAVHSYTCADDLTMPWILHVVTEADGCCTSEQGGLLTSCLFRNADHCVPRSKTNDLIIRKSRCSRMPSGSSFFILIISDWYVSWPIKYFYAMKHTISSSTISNIHPFLSVIHRYHPFL